MSRLSLRRRCPNCAAKRQTPNVERQTLKVERRTLNVEPERPASPAALSTRRIDAISPNGVVNPFSNRGLDCGNALENCRVDRKRRLLNPILPPMDRIGACKKKHYPDWILGVQSAWQRIGAELLCLLSARFGRGNYDNDAAPSLHQEPVPEVARGADREEG
jgi:hypothetical protein